MIAWHIRTVECGGAWETLALWFCPFSELRKGTEPFSVPHLAFLFISFMGWCCMCRLGSRADLKGGWLSWTLLLLTILMKYKFELQRSILGAAAPPSIRPAFSILLGPPMVSVDPASEELQSLLGRQLTGLWVFTPSLAFSMWAFFPVHLQTCERSSSENWQFSVICNIWTYY